MSARGVLVVGAVNVDLVVRAARLPGPGETVVGAGVERFGGGKGANAAVAAARSGAAVRLVGAVGADDLGAAALAELRAEGVDVGAVAVRAGVATGTALIVVDAAGENQIAVGAGANATVDAGQVRVAVAAARGWAGCVLVSTEIPAGAVAAAVETAARHGIRCVLDPAPVLPVLVELLGHGPVLTPNAGELRDLAELLGSGGADPAGPGGPRAPATRGAAELASSLGRRTGAPVVVTLGGDGVLLAGPDGGERGEGGVERVPARPTARVVDTTGAGDTFTGVFAAALATGAELPAAVRRAVVAAALSVGAPGARGGMPTAAAIDAASTG